MSIVCYPRFDAVKDREGVYYEVRCIHPVDSDKRTAFLISNKPDDIRKLEESEGSIGGAVLSVQKNGFFDWSRSEIINYVGEFRSGLEVFNYLQSKGFFDLSKSQVVKKSGLVVRMMMEVFGKRAKD